MELVLHKFYPIIREYLHVLTTPSAGFTTDVFAVNDEVFVEGITKYSSDGTGFNASDYGFKFFTVSKYENKFTPGLNADQVTFNLVLD